MTDPRQQIVAAMAQREMEMRGKGAATLKKGKPGKGKGMAGGKGVAAKSADNC